MEKVFLVFKQYQFEGDDLLGVFRNYEDAVKFAEKQKGYINIQEHIVQ